MSLGMGSDNQNTASVTNSVFFNPTITVGDKNDTDQKQATDLTSAVTPKQDNSYTGSLGLGIGGSGSGGPVQRSGDIDDAPQVLGAKKAIDNVFGNPSVIYIAGAVAISGLAYYLYNKKKSK